VEGLKWLPLQKALFELPFRDSWNRAALEEELVSASLDGSIERIQDDARKNSRPLRFWPLMPLGWNAKNSKKVVSFTGMALMMPVFAATMIGVGIRFENLWPVIAGLFFGYFGFPLFMGFGLEASLNEDRDSKYPLLRAWTILESYNQGRVPRTIRELQVLLEKVHTPVTQAHYLLRHEQLRKLRKPFAVAFAISMAALVGTQTRAPPLVGPMTYSWLFLVITVGFMLGIEAADMYERYYRPVLHSELSEQMEDQTLSQAGIDIDEILAGFESRWVFFRVRAKALLAYLLGPLCGFNLWELALPAASIFAVGLVFVTQFYVHPASQASQVSWPILCVAEIIFAMMIPYSVYSSWKKGGGYRKAMTRKALLHRIVFSLYPTELISREKFTEILASADYNIEVEEATEDQVIAKLFVDSIPGSFRWS
jgi:hypothetical protein